MPSRRWVTSPPATSPVSTGWLRSPSACCRCRCRTESDRLAGQNVLDDVAIHVGETEGPAVVAVGQLRVVQTQQVKDGRLQVVDADAVVNRLVAEVVGLAVMDAALDAASC